MVHTYLGAELEETLERARGPFMNYMRAHVSVLRPLAKSLGINEPSKEQLDRLSGNCVRALFSHCLR